MANDVLSIAWKYIKRRKFATAIKLLEGRSEIYEENFEYNLMLATACLYAGDIGVASSYFQRARRIKLTDTRLLLGQAAIFLRRGDTDRALQYYLEIKENDPNNKTATEAIEFIRTKGDYDTICRWVDSGRIEQFYPPLGINPDKVCMIVFPSIACVLGVLFVMTLITNRKTPYQGTRLDLTELALTTDEKKNVQEKNLAENSFHYILSDKEILQSYEKALEYFQSSRDNAAQVEVNRIINSNASNGVKQKARVLSGYLTNPTFDSILDVPSYQQVNADPLLYIDCWVSWSGRISDMIVDKDGMSCRLLIGYEKMKNIDGIVDLRFDMDQNIVTDLPLRVLAKICSDDNGKLYLQGRAVYQSIHDGLENK